MIEIEFAYITRHGFIVRSHLLKPDSIVLPQCFTRREPHESRTIALLGVPLIAQLIKLCFGYCGEPPLKGVAILVRAQLNDIRNAIVI